MTFEEIKKLTWHQYLAIVMHPRDEKGQLVPRIESDGRQRFANEQEKWFFQWQGRWGWTRAQCEKKWAENEELAKFRAELNKLNLGDEEFARRVREKTLEIMRRRSR